MMTARMHILGASGSAFTTLGRALLGADLERPRLPIYPDLSLSFGRKR